MDNNQEITKTALVTGGSRGIGAATVLRLAQDGADVAFTYQSNHDRAREVARQVEALGRRSLAIQADGADPTAMREAVGRVAETFGRLDVLVNNAAAFIVGEVGALTLDDYEETMAVNVRAPFVATQAALPHLRAGGRIVNIGSNAAERAVFPGFSLYAASKSALAGMTKALGRELGPRAITVNLVNPGPTDTELNPADGPLAATVTGFTALGHYARPDDVAAAVAFLAGPDGRYLTGTTVNVDGGWAA
ncbi:MAG: SDR family oxidoreductase [Nocardioidaceae bacterium]|nr:SDR family oxidoreductase [Nocardioidaceae bacterium]